jgi:hypothetical protein
VLIRLLQDLIEELIGEEIEDETDASLSPSLPTAAHALDTSAKLHVVRKRRETVTKQKSTQQVQFLNYISEKRQTKSAAVGSETVLVVCATLRAKHPDLFGPLKFGDGALESYIQHCKVTVFDASDSSNSISFPHVICEFERAVSTPFMVLQVRAFVQGCISMRMFFI